MRCSASYILFLTEWLKTRTARLTRPLSISKYAYAEVRDPFGGVLERVKVKEEDGVYAGYILLSDAIRMIL